VSREICSVGERIFAESQGGMLPSPLSTLGGSKQPSASKSIEWLKYGSHVDS
jgi:hypothetical protein